MNGWTTPADIRARLLRDWNQGQLLSARITGEPLFPWTMRVRGPDSRALAERFDEVRQWIRTLVEGSTTDRGFGYEIEWIEIKHRQLGRNRVPVAIRVPEEAGALRLIEKIRDAVRFQQAADLIVAEFPMLQQWVIRRPLTVLDRAADWPRLLAVLGWFCRHPRPGIYLRQLDIPGVDTKFIETRKGLLTELLDRVLPEEAVARQFTGSRGFEPRYGLLSKPVLVRFRLLDPRSTLHGLTDLAVPVDQFARLNPAVSRVFVTENEINGLAFPEIPRSLVIFGLGYSLDRLAEVRWLAGKGLFYWGDIDTHGFAMLDRFRSAFPDACSLLMDRETLLAHRKLWGIEQSPHQGELPRLNPHERSLYDDLRDNRYGDRLRLEQERIPFGWVKRGLPEYE